MMLFMLRYVSYENERLKFCLISKNQVLDIWESSFHKYNVKSRG